MSRWICLSIILCCSGAALVPGLAAANEPEANAPLPPQEAARTMVVPEGFRVTLFAGEPDVMQPIAFCIDDRGRLWVAEAYNYPNKGETSGDRILIFADTDNDGRFDHRTVFYDKLNYVTGVETGFGGVWVMSPPHFYFIPDRNGDDQPDGEPELLLDGFGNHANAHNLANGLAWGPDGWLYGTHGRTNWSMVGRPGALPEDRVRFDGGIYRYHPVRHTWEAWADGTTNPWGIDWNDVGEAFVCNCVNPHLFHVIPGAHYEPWRNRESSRFAYERIPTIADHLHFAGGSNVRGGLGTPAEDEMGGGHAHCGTMVYLGDTWPVQYRNSVFMNNIHGRRINNDILRRAGSGYCAGHGRDLLVSRDPWYMGVTLRYGPDGSVFASDWSDTGECHSVRNTQRQTGRIFKITYGPQRSAPRDVAQCTNEELVELQSHRNDWHVQHARRLLQERAGRGDDMTRVKSGLHVRFAGADDAPGKLRALWALHVIGGLDEEFLLGATRHEDERVRAWAVRLLCEAPQLPEAAGPRFQELAASDPSPVVRLYLASMMQRLPPGKRWEVSATLAARAGDATDANLPLMIWYGLEPLVHADIDRFAALAVRARIPLIRRNIARRAAEADVSGRGLDALLRQLRGIDDDQILTDLFEGLLLGIEGRRSVDMPADWPAVQAAVQVLVLAHGNERLQDLAVQLALIFNDPAALETMRRTAADREAPAASRRRAIAALVARHADGTEPLLLACVGDAATRSAALRGLAEFDDPHTVSTILDNFAAFDAECREDAVQTLASRPEWARALLDAVAREQIPRRLITAFTARQLRNMKDGRVQAQVRAVWGEVRATPADRRALIESYKQKLQGDSLKNANRGAGRALFQKTCANCHRLFDAGGAIGPDITGAQRQNLDYLLESLIDPSAAVSKDFQMQVIETKAGRVITGMIVAESEAAVTVQTATERIVVPVAEIEDRVKSDVSMMPDGMVQQLSADELRDLVGYLSGTTQVPLPEPAGATPP